MNADVDYEVEYNNRARVPENPAIMAGWSRDAKAYREAHQGRLRGIPYGPGERHRIDLFAGDDAGPIVVFIHGGYWQALDGSFFSHLAGGLNAQGIDVAIPSYDLCPNVSIDELSSKCVCMRELAKLGRPLVISGHSAGGHLAACMLATDWRALDAVVAGNDLCRGLHHFGAVRPSSTGQNVAQQGAGLDDAIGEGGKSLVLGNRRRGILDAVVGGNESAEYFRQTRSLSSVGRGGHGGEFWIVPGANHFTAHRAAGRSRLHR